MKAACLLLALASVLAPPPAEAQLPDPGRPGPYVIDLRGSTAGLPAADAFFTDAELDRENVTLPTRGLGVDIGGHVYAGRLGPAHLGFGASLLRVSGSGRTFAPREEDPTSQAPATGEAIGTTVTVMAPQLSFNFGSANGWSYLGAGYGRGHVRDAGWVPVINLGGGARWFLTRHAAFGFDLRYHRFGAGEGSPGISLFAVSVGVSIR